jgi:hypothetical protein
MNCTYCEKDLTDKQIKNFEKSVKSGKNIERRPFCSLSCGTSYRLKIDAVKREKLYNDNPVLCKCCSTKISYTKFIEKKTDKHNRIKKTEEINMFCSRSCAAKHNNKGNNRHSVIKREITNILTLWSRDILRDVLNKLNLDKCSLCGTDDITCDIHHIKGRNIEDCDNHDNLTIVCPNCHRRIHENKIDNGKLIKLSSTMPINWKEYLPEKYR